MIIKHASRVKIKVAIVAVALTILMFLQVLQEVFAILRGKSLLTEAALVEVHFIVDNRSIVNGGKMIHEQVTELEGVWTFRAFIAFLRQRMIGLCV